MAIDYGTDKEDENVWTAASDGDLDAVRRYIETLGVDPNIKDDYGYTPLAAAVSYNHTPLIQYLLDKGADVNVVDGDGETPLFYCESKEIAELLVSQGANIHVLNHENMSILDRAEEEAGSQPTDLTEYYLSLGIERRCSFDGEEEEEDDDDAGGSEDDDDDEQ